MRKFYLQNALGERVDLNDVSKMVMTDPSGLGLSYTINQDDISNGFYKRTKIDYPAIQIMGDINFTVDPYETLGVISSYWMPFSTGNSQIFVTNEPYYTSGSNRMPNKNLSWEKTTQWNIGIDFSFLKGRIGGTIDMYTSTTKDLLLAMSVPSLSGYPSMMANIGKTKNKGIEITLNTIPVLTKDFTWNGRRYRQHLVHR